jgi:hypothetical protein
MLVWTIVAVKVVTIVVTIAVAQSWDAGAIIGLTSWIWLPAIGVLVAGPLLFRRRLRRVRARRAALIRAEWMLDAANDARPAAEPTSVRRRGRHHAQPPDGRDRQPAEGG